MWIGYWGGGLDYYDRKTGKVKRFLNDPKNPRSISDNNIFYLFEDSKKNMWICTWGKGISKYVKDTDDFTNYMHDPKKPNSLGSPYAPTHISEDHLGNLWISMKTGRGLDKLDPITEVFTLYKSESKAGDISNNSVYIL